VTVKHNKNKNKKVKKVTKKNDMETKIRKSLKGTRSTSTKQKLHNSRISASEAIGQTS